MLHDPPPAPIGDDHGLDRTTLGRLDARTHLRFHARVHLGLTRVLALEWAGRGVRVNAISPGEIDTSILSPGTEKLVEQIPQRRLGTPDEVAKAIAGKGGVVQITFGTGFVNPTAAANMQAKFRERAALQARNAAARSSCVRAASGRSSER